MLSLFPVCACLFNSICDANASQLSRLYPVNLYLRGGAHNQCILYCSCTIARVVKWSRPKSNIELENVDCHLLKQMTVAQLAANIAIRKLRRGCRTCVNAVGIDVRLRL